MYKTKGISQPQNWSNSPLHQPGEKIMATFEYYSICDSSINKAIYFTFWIYYNLGEKKKEGNRRTYVSQ